MPMPILPINTGGVKRKRMPNGIPRYISSRIGLIRLSVIVANSVTVTNNVVIFFIVSL